MKKLSVFPLAAGISFFGAPVHAALNVYLSPPGTQSSSIATDTVNFNSAPTGDVDAADTAIGDYSGDGTIFDNDQFGGHLLGNYLAVSAGDSVTIDLDLTPLIPGDTNVYYFGLFFTAGDGYNTFEIRSNGVTIQTFNTQALLNKIPNTSGSTITSLNGDVHDTEDYYGQPVTGSNSSEPYAYLNIVATGSTTFDQIVISQSSAAAGARFESDNHSVSSVPITTLPGEFIDVTDSVPEPAAPALALSCLGLLAFRRRR